MKNIQIETYRMKNGWSKAECARRLNITPNVLSTIERTGKVDWPLAKEISALFGATYATLGLKIPSVSDLDNELWPWFGKWIRLIESRGSGYGTCITCGKNLHYKDANCGHYIPRGNKVVKYHRTNNHFQCVRCNKYGNGEYVKYRKVLLQRYGEAHVNWLEDQEGKPSEFDRDLLWGMLQYYKTEVGKMEQDDSYLSKEYETKL